MTDEIQRDAKKGFLEGMLDGILMKSIWDDRTAKAEKDFGYFMGNIAAGAVQPGAWACVGLDLGRDNYKF